MPCLPGEETENCEQVQSKSDTKNIFALFQAQAATLTIAQAFNLAFDRWKGKSEEEKLYEEKFEVCKCCCRLKDNSDSSVNNAIYNLKDETKADNAILKLENAGTRESIAAFPEKEKIQFLILQDLITVYIVRAVILHL